MPPHAHSEIIAEKTEADIVEFKQHWPNQLKEWAESAKVAKDEAERLDFEDGVRFAQSIIDTFPQLELRLQITPSQIEWNSKGPNAPQSS